MSWKSISRISLTQTSASAQHSSPEPSKAAPQEPAKQDQEASTEDLGREGQKEALREMYLAGKPFDELLSESGIPRATLFRWRREGKWDDEKNKKAILAQKLADTLAFYDNPENTEQAIAESNLKLLLRIQGINLSKIMHRAASGEAPDLIAITMSDSLSKYANMLEKLIKSDQSIKSGGVEKKEVVHIHQIDMDDALNLALELRRKGQQITVQEAMVLLQAQQSSKKIRSDEQPG